jgi:hypothetical protein
MANDTKILITAMEGSGFYNRNSDLQLAGITLAVLRRGRTFDLLRGEPLVIARRKFTRLVVGAVALPAILRVAKAQTYPTRPVTMLVPFPAGGGTDAVARMIADGMRTSLGQTVIIENLAGASGTIGVGRVIRAAGDGYTLVTGGWDTFVANGAVYALPYNLLNDFSPKQLPALRAALDANQNKNSHGVLARQANAA